MKIITKHKDYYDYIPHIYGIDEKVVLDRSDINFDFNYYDITNYNRYKNKNTTEIKFESFALSQLWIGFHVVDVLYDNNRDIFYIGEEIHEMFKNNKNIKYFRDMYLSDYPYEVKEGLQLKEIEPISLSSYYSRYIPRSYRDMRTILYRDNIYKDVDNRIKLDESLFNTDYYNKMEQFPPIIFVRNYHNNYTSHNIILSKLDIPRIIQPNDAYQYIYEYISYKNTEKENHIDTRTDVQKLESKGFNKKTSFRPKLKRK